MSSLISHNGELIRIKPTDPSKLEYSNNDGRSWSRRGSHPRFAAAFQDLQSSGKEILAVTTEGLYYSTNEGRSWVYRSR